jgi:hypothetical protein
MSSYRDLLTEHYFSAMERQYALRDWLVERGNPDWEFDMNVGRLQFGTIADFPVQLIGTEGDQSKTWLWSWANTASKIPANLLTLSNRLKTYGQKYKIPEFTIPQIKLDNLFHGHHIGMLTSGLLNCNAYYRGPYPTGALFYLIQDPEYPVTLNSHPSQIVNHITQMVAMGPPIDLRRATQSYLTQRGIQSMMQATSLVGEFADGSTLQVDFDARGRVSNIGSTLKSNEPS